MAFLKLLFAILRHTFRDGDLEEIYADPLTRLTEFINVNIKIQLIVYGDS